MFDGIDELAELCRAIDEVTETEDGRDSFFSAADIYKLGRRAGYRAGVRAGKAEVAQTGGEA